MPDRERTAVFHLWLLGLDSEEIAEVIPSRYEPDWIDSILLSAREQLEETLGDYHFNAFSSADVFTRCAVCSAERNAGSAGPVSEHILRQVDR